jgi:hypothetical protein
MNLLAAIIISTVKIPIKSQEQDVSEEEMPEAATTRQISPVTAE